jgi:hypothetical protein
VDWHDIKLLASIAAGLMLAFLLSTADTIKAKIASVLAGLFFAVFFTEPLIDWAGLDVAVWKYAVSGLLAMTGDRLARRMFMIADTTRLPWGGDK